MFLQKSIEMYKIIVYTTTFRGVRATFEECKSVISVLYNFRVRVEERDIYMNAIFHNELEERLNRTKVSVPQVFISGQHIGVSSQCKPTPPRSWDAEPFNVIVFSLPYRVLRK